MVRRPRPLMVCSLLALAMALALASRLAPGGSMVAAMPSRVPVATDVPGWTMRGWDAPLPAEPAASGAPADAAIGLDGHRQPRSPRMSREALERTTR